ncbi:hypothetical protein ACTD5D_25285 [Nocardia takedensis]|uniref:hypothetical protein n=1 Tax=Nocardia takedensis TaxID=259390 RepID=UPI0002EF474E|nr:hypothetical protein [Nocardia takedensis]
MTTAVRAVLLLVGVALAGYGISLLLDFPPDALTSVALWLAAGILLHDAVFAPLAAALGLTGRRLLPRGWWPPLACGAVCTVALLLLAAPVVGRRDALPDNPTVLDRDYPLGLTLALLLIWSIVALTLLLGRRGAAKR